MDTNKKIFYQNEAPEVKPNKRKIFQKFQRPLAIWKILADFITI